MPSDDCHLSDTPILKVRSQAAGLWRSVEANPEEEGQDHQEAGAEDGVLCVQMEEPGAHQEDQALRAWRGEEEEGSDDPVLAVPAALAQNVASFRFDEVVIMVRVVFLHPDLGIGGAERLIVDCSLALQSKVWFE